MMTHFRLRVFLCALCASAVSLAQSPFFPTPSYFKQVFLRPGKYTLQAPAPLKDLVEDGKLRLSIPDVVRLVVGRNTEVWLARLDVEASGPAVLSAYGPFDPRFTGSFSSSRAVAPSFTQLQASKSLSQQTQFGYQQNFQTGTGYSVTFNGFKSASNSPFSTLNPAIQTSMGFSLSQPLWRNRGFFIQRAPIVIARINQQVSRGRFEQKLSDTLQSAMNQYWDVVQARESLAVLRNSLGLAEKSYARDKRALELGALPPLDIYRSEAEVANRKVQVVTAEYQLKLQEDALRVLIGADLDSGVRMLTLDLVDSAAPPLGPQEVNVEEAVERALRSRPELDVLRRQQTVQDVNIRVALNSLKPDLRLGGGYSSSGLGGNSFRPNGTLLATGGLEDALNQVFDFHNPTYGFSLTLNLPIKSRQAEAELASSEIARRRNLFEQRQIEQQVALEVRNAGHRLEQSKANIVAATAARDLARKTLDAEQRKYDLGASTVFFVLEAQQRASDAETQLLAASISYKKAVIAVQRSSASLLPENNVVIEQALAVK
jgi:outer membrane protein